MYWLVFCLERPSKILIQFLAFLFIFIFVFVVIDLSLPFISFFFYHFSFSFYWARDSFTYGYLLLVVLVLFCSFGFFPLLFLLIFIVYYFSLFFFSFFFFFFLFQNAVKLHKLALGGGGSLQGSKRQQKIKAQEFIHLHYPFSSSSTFLCNILLVVGLFPSFHLFLSVLLVLVSIIFFILHFYVLCLSFTFCSPAVPEFIRLFLFSSSWCFIFLFVFIYLLSSFWFGLFLRFCGFLLHLFILLCVCGSSSLFFASYLILYHDQCVLRLFLHLLGTIIINNEGEDKRQREREERK